MPSAAGPAPKRSLRDKCCDMNWPICKIFCSSIHKKRVFAHDEMILLYWLKMSMITIIYIRQVGFKSYAPHVNWRGIARLLETIGTNFDIRRKNSPSCLNLTIHRDYVGIISLVNGLINQKGEAIALSSKILILEAGDRRAEIYSRYPLDNKSNMSPQDNACLESLGYLWH